MSERPLHLGEPADEAAWRALVKQGLKGGPWTRLVGKTADGIALEPLYRETDVATAGDEAGMPGAAPFVRGVGGWTIRQAFEHHDPEQTNREILADLAGGVGGIELVIDPTGVHGAAIKNDRDLDVALADVILEAAPVSLDLRVPGELQDGIADTLREKLKGVAVSGTAFNLNPIGAWMARDDGQDGLYLASHFTARHCRDLPRARFLRSDARVVHEAGGTEAQEIASALSAGIIYLRELERRALSIEQSARAISFAVSVGPDVLIESAKLRALRLCWARILEASGVAPENRAAHIHAFTSRRMMTRYDAWTNILRVTTAAFAAAVGGADDITTYPLTDALGLPTAFGRRVARNTQNVLMEECRLGHVADPAGGAWFVEKLTQELAAKAWEIMQSIESEGGIVAALSSGSLQKRVSEAREARQKLIDTRRETITGVSDFPLLGAKPPEFVERAARAASEGALVPIRWAAPFEALRASAEKHAPCIFFANLATLAEFGPRAQFARNFFGVGGIASVGEEDAYATMEALVDAFRVGGTRVAVIASTDGCYAEQAENCAQRLKAAGADWIVLAGKPGEREPALRAAGVDQFIYAGVDVVTELETLHGALGVTP